MKEKAKKAAGILFWMGMLCELIVSPSGYLFGGYREPVIIVTGMAFFSVSVLLRICGDLAGIKKELPVYAIVFLYGLLCYFAQHSALVLRIALVIVAGREKKAADVIRFFFFGTIVILLYGALLAALGFHNSLAVTDLFRHENEWRLTLGFFHPNGLAFFLFRIFVMWIYLYGAKVRPLPAVLFSLSLGILLFLAKSKMGCMVFALLIAGLIAARVVKSQLFDRILWIGGITFGAGCLLVFTCLRLWNFPKRHYGDEENYWDYMNVYTSGRLEHARDALLQTPYSLFGSRNVPDGTEIGYVNAFLNQGIIFMLLFAILFFLLYRDLYRKKDRYGMLLAISFLVYAMAEAYLPYFNKNGIWMLMLGTGLSVSAASGKEIGKTDGERKR